MRGNPPVSPSLAALTSCHLWLAPAPPPVPGVSPGAGTGGNPWDVLFPQQTGHRAASVFFLFCFLMLSPSCWPVPQHDWETQIPPAQPRMLHRTGPAVPVTRGCPTAAGTGHRGLRTRWAVPAGAQSLCCPLPTLSPGRTGDGIDPVPLQCQLCCSPGPSGWRSLAGR